MRQFLHAGIFAVLLLASSLSISTLSAAPLSVDEIRQVSGTEKAVQHATEISTQGASVALANDPQGNGFLGRAQSSSFLDIALSPALVLFLVALGAIGWLGRRRNKDDILN